ncbi:hypothetical protein HYS94_05380 [Candidatus Daviesbacteria bacterium]|nr:hypothetical protein [Candidatus Daviesbacteria bacterium]
MIELLERKLSKPLYPLTERPHLGTRFEYFAPTEEVRMISRYGAGIVPNQPLQTVRNTSYVEMIDESEEIIH